MESEVQSARKLLREPKATADLGLCSAATHDVPNDSFFSAM